MPLPPTTILRPGIGLDRMRDMVYCVGVTLSHHLRRQLEEKP
jgi:hypothetical protein